MVFALKIWKLKFSNNSNYKNWRTNWKIIRKNTQWASALFNKIIPVLNQFKVKIQLKWCRNGKMCTKKVDQIFCHSIDLSECSLHIVASTSILFCGWSSNNKGNSHCGWTTSKATKYTRMNRIAHTHKQRWSCIWTD